MQLVDEALASLGSLDPAGLPGPWPPGGPLRDVLRSPAAARVGELAARDGLFLFQFEHRFELDLPEAWGVAGEPDEVPTWTDGVLPEPKYRNFRHDLAVASFHPGHRGKWTTHELCHALVGFAWRPEASALFHATAARLAELLPVVLYYFFDEVRLTRCPTHAGGGPLFRAFCADCERVASFRPLQDEDVGHLEAGLAFLDAELAAIARTRREGVPIAHRFGGLDLCSDGLAYARSHGPRLGSEAMERLQPFLVEGGGWSTRLDDLEARVLEVARGLLLGDPVRAFAANAEAGRERWVRQDLAFRLLTVREETDGPARSAIEDLVERLQTGTPAEAVAGWRELEAEYVLPTAEMVFAVGYELERVLFGRSHGQVRDGLRSVAPLVMELTEDAGADLTAAFLPADPPVREGLGDRFVRWLSDVHPDLAPLASLEVGIRSVKADPLVALGAGTGIRLADGARLLRADGDLLALSEAVDGGTVVAAVQEGRLTLEGWEPDGDWALAIGRDPSGELVMLALDPQDAEDLAVGVATDELAAVLREHGVARPLRWTI